MRPKHFLAVDLGATSGRILLASLDGGLLDTETLHRFPNRMVRVGGRYYWNIYTLYEQIVEGLCRAGRRNVRIESIGIDSWGVDMAFVAGDGTLCGLPRSYRDPCTDGMPEIFFRDRIPRREVYRRTGIQIMNFNSLFQLCAARRDGCAALENAEKILFIPDALSYLLTGETVCEYTVLSTSQFMNPATKRPDAELLAAAGVDAALIPRVVMPGERIGTLCDTVARETGLGPVPVVAVAEHDTASAVAAVPAANERFAYISSGTWSLMGIELCEPLITDQTYALNFTNEGGVDGTTRLLKNITGMWITEQCLKKWKDEGRSYTYPEIMRMAAGAAPFRAMIDPDDASFAAPGDMPAAIRAYCKRTGQPLPDDDGSLIRTLFESLALKYRFVLDRFRTLAPFEIERLHVIGGGSRNALLNRFTADSTGLPLTAGPSEATAVGNIMLQARAAGCVASLREMRSLIARCIPCESYAPGDTAPWDKAFARFETLVNKT